MWEIQHVAKKKVKTREAQAEAEAPPFLCDIYSGKWHAVSRNVPISYNSYK